MKNLKLTNLERMQENEMTQVRGGLFGMGKKYCRISGGCVCVGSCATANNSYTGRKYHGNNFRNLGRDGK